MRNKILLIGMISAMLGISAAYAAAAEIELNGMETDPKEYSTKQYSDALKQEVKNGNLYDTGTKDEVTINNGLYKVDTNGLEISMYPPFRWLCYTQDIDAQLDMYTITVKDPLEMAKTMVENDTHLLAVDGDHEMMVEVRVLEDELGEKIDNSASLKPADEKEVLDYLEENVFKDWEMESPYAINGNRYYVAVKEDGNKRVYETYVDEKCIDVLCYTLDGSEFTDDQLETIEDLLGDLYVE